MSVSLSHTPSCHPSLTLAHSFPHVTLIPSRHTPRHTCPHLPSLPGILVRWPTQGLQLSCPLWATSWDWGIATERTSCLIRPMGTVSMLISTACSTGYVGVRRVQCHMLVTWLSHAGHVTCSHMMNRSVTLCHDSVTLCHEVTWE